MTGRAASLHAVPFHEPLEQETAAYIGRAREERKNTNRLMMFTRYGLACLMVIHQFTSVRVSVLAVPLALRPCHLKVGVVLFMAVLFVP